MADGYFYKVVNIGIKGWGDGNCDIKRETADIKVVIKVFSAYIKKDNNS